MPLDQEQLKRIRYHLGYPITNPASAISMNVPISFPAVFLTEFGATHLSGAYPEEQVRTLLDRMDTLDAAIFDAHTRKVARKVDEIELNPDEPDELEAEYVRWGFRLAELLGGKPNPYSSRYKNAAGWTVRVA